MRFVLQFVSFLFSFLFAGYIGFLNADVKSTIDNNIFDNSIYYLKPNKIGDQSKEDIEKTIHSCFGDVEQFITQIKNEDDVISYYPKEDIEKGYFHLNLETYLLLGRPDTLKFTTPYARITLPTKIVASIPYKSIYFSSFFDSSAISSCIYVDFPVQSDGGGVSFKQMSIYKRSLYQFDNSSLKRDLVDDEIACSAKYYGDTFYFPTIKGYKIEGIQKRNAPDLQSVFPDSFHVVDIGEEQDYILIVSDHVFDVLSKQFDYFLEWDVLSNSTNRDTLLSLRKS